MNPAPRSKSHGLKMMTPRDKLAIPPRLDKLGFLWGGVNWLSAALLLFKKDLFIELRTREVLNTLLVFSILCILLFSFAWKFSRETVLDLVPGLLWITFVFAGVLGLGRVAANDREENRIEGLLLSPVSGSTIYLGKLVTILTFLLTIEFLCVPLFIVFFDLPLNPKFAWILLALFLGTVGFSAVGVLLSAVSVRTRLREMFLPVLMLPVIVPVLVGAVKATESAFSKTAEISEGIFWLKFLAGYDLIFLILGLLLYEYAISE